MKYKYDLKKIIWLLFLAFISVFGIFFIIFLINKNKYAPINFHNLDPKQLEHIQHIDFYKENNSLLKEQEDFFVENFRGHRNRRPLRRRRHLHYPQRTWYGNNWGYGYRPPPPYYVSSYYYPPPPPPPLYYYTWYNPFTWFSPVCKEGCVLTGNNEYGCQRPGIGPDQCVFASDCAGC